MTELLYGVAVAPFKDMVGSPAFFVEVLTGGVFAGLMYSLVALGFVLIFKASGVFNFAQGAMVLFAALTLVGLIARGVPVALALLLTTAVMVALAWVIERVVLRPLVNQEHIILFMATIGLTFFLEGFGEMVWGANVKKLDIGIPGRGARRLLPAHPHRPGAPRRRRRPRGGALDRHPAQDDLDDRLVRGGNRRDRRRDHVGRQERRAVQPVAHRAQVAARPHPRRLHVRPGRDRGWADHRRGGEDGGGLLGAARGRRHRELVRLRARAGIPPVPPARIVRGEDH